MKRFLWDRLVQWKEEKGRKPLIIRGARQVGKTWLMKEFGQQAYRQVAYINFERSGNLKSLFELGFDIPRLITGIEIETGLKIYSDDTLIIFDEIQESESALTSLKYFCENAPQYHIMAAGSLLGVSLHSQRSFPVGKVDFADLYPLSFGEFLMAIYKESYFQLLQKKDWPLIEGFAANYTALLRQYYFTGGMPEVVNSFVQENDLTKVRVIQNRLLDAYEQDFSKHAPYELVPRIRMVWQSIPAQLAKENKKFVYGLLKKGARAKEFELAIAWLLDAGLLHKVNRISKPAIPLLAYLESAEYKLYLLDIGLLAAMGSIEAKTLLQGNALFAEFKGAMAEQYVLQELKSNGTLPIYYWTAEKASAEVDFIVQYQDNIIPIEVKAAENLKAKSLKSYYDQFKPGTSIRTSLSNYRKEEWLINIPLFAIAHFFEP